MSLPAGNIPLISDWATSARPWLNDIRSFLEGQTGDPDQIRDTIRAMIVPGGGINTNWNASLKTLTISSPTGFAALPSGAVVSINFNNGWSSRPTSRTDLRVLWIGGNIDNPPAGQITGDLWVREIIP